MCVPISLDVDDDCDDDDDEDEEEEDDDDDDHGGSFLSVFVHLKCVSIHSSHFAYIT